MDILLSTTAYNGCLMFGFTRLFMYFPNFSKTQLGAKIRRSLISHCAVLPYNNYPLTFIKEGQRELLS